MRVRPITGSITINDGLKQLTGISSVNNSRTWKVIQNYLSRTAIQHTVGTIMLAAFFTLEPSFFCNLFASFVYLILC